MAEKGTVQLQVSGARLEDSQGWVAGSLWKDKLGLEDGEDCLDRRPVPSCAQGMASEDFAPLCCRNRELVQAQERLILSEPGSGMPAEKRLFYLLSWPPALGLSPSVQEKSSFAGLREDPSQISVSIRYCGSLFLQRNKFWRSSLGEAAGPQNVFGCSCRAAGVRIRELQEPRQALEQGHGQKEAVYPRPPQAHWGSCQKSGTGSGTAPGAVGLPDPGPGTRGRTQRRRMGTPPRPACAAAFDPKAPFQLRLRRARLDGIGGRGLRQGRGQTWPIKAAAALRARLLSAAAAAQAEESAVVAAVAAVAAALFPARSAQRGPGCASRAAAAEELRPQSGSDPGE